MISRTDVHALILVRHGETAYNADGRFRGRADPPLTQRGRIQARAAAGALAWCTAARIGSSPRTRAQSTAEVLSQRIGRAARTDDRFDDIDYGDWTGLTRAEVVAQWPVEYALWLEAPDRLRIPHGERVAAARDRVWTAVGEFARESAATIVVTHDVCVRLALCALLDAPLNAMHALRVDLASITVLAFRADGAQLVRSNDTSHLRHLDEDDASEAGR
jgi:broad specificity phosphatase PhoE